MSLAFNASPFNSDSDYTDVKNGDTPITRKKQSNSKTQKRPLSSSGNTEKVNNLLASIHNSSSSDNDMGDFNPPDPPQSSGVQNTILKEHSNGSKVAEPPLYSPNDDEVNMDDLSSKSYAEDYYRKMIPNYGKKTNNMYQQNEPPSHGSQLHQRNDYYSQQQTPMYQPPMPMYQSQPSQGDMMEKLNYMINLLEEHHDERTGSVTEEVILYSFLGIFIIFIADSFARVGKYTR